MSKFAPRSMSSYMGKDLEYSIENILHHPSLTIVHAPTGGMKSLFILAMMSKVAQGLPFMGNETIQKNVYYVDFEMSERSISKRASDLDLELIPESQLAYVIPPEDGDFDFSDDEVQDKFCEFMKDNDYDIIVLDNLRTGFTIQDENAAGEFSDVNRFIKRLRQIEKSVIMIHHDNKSGDASGSTNIATVYDYRLQIKPSTDPSVKELIVHKDRDDSGMYRTWDRQSIRYEGGDFYLGEDGLVSLSVQLEFVVSDLSNGKYATIESLGRAIANTGATSKSKENYTYAKICAVFNSHLSDPLVDTVDKIRAFIKAK